MKFTHVYDESFVLTYIVAQLYNGSTLDSRELTEEFGYHRSSMYKLIGKIRNNIEMVDPEHQVVRIAAFKFKLSRVSDGREGTG